MRYSFSRTRESYIPKTFEYTVKDKNSDAIVYVLADNVIKAFAGKRAKPDLYLRFRSPEALAQRIAEYFAGIAASKARKAACRAELNKPSSLAVGDVLQSMWGYDQTNIDYYEVTKVLGAAYVEIRELAQLKAETGFMSGKCTPVVGEYIGEPMRKKVKNGNSVRIESFANAYKIEPEIIAGAKVYKASNWTAYA